MVARHLDGYPLWPTVVANLHMPAGYRSRRDLVGDLTQAVRGQGHWNDIGWPAESDPDRLFAHYYDAVPDGVVNDRWTQVRLPANRGEQVRFTHKDGAVYAMVLADSSPTPSPSAV
jgi:alpha-L-fucosidase